MKNKRALLFYLLISAFCVLAFVPSQDGGIEKLVASLQRWADTNPQEKVYIHTDKPYYALGDTLWFKAYVTVGSRHQLSAMSGALYVELLNPQDSMVRSLKLPLITGTTFGDFTLDEDLPVGNYRLRAYTQWMRNAGEDYFFDRTIIVGSLDGAASNPSDPGFKSQKTEGSRKNKNLVAATQQADIQFFPESGNLVSGIASKLGFKAVGPDGNGISIKGVILDESGKEIIDFQSLYAGMGSVVLKPEAGRSYKAKITLPDSSIKTLDLPKVLEQGYVLSVYPTLKDSVLVRIGAASGITQQKTESLNLVVQSGGEVIFSSQVKIGRSITSIWLSKTSFPSGIAQFTLFNSNNEPLNERIAFIKSRDHMELSLSSSKQTYKSREPISLNLLANTAAGTPTGGTFSVSVIDESKVPFDDGMGHTIYSDILLSSDLKGFIETPNYYFNKETDEVDIALDNLMLTQGYRRFDWKSITPDSIAKPIFPAEGIGTIFSGKVLGLNGKPQPGASVMMMSLKADLIKNSKADLEGRFRFDEELVLTDSIRITFQAKNQKNGTKVELILDSVPKIVPAKRRSKTSVDEQVEEQLQVYIENSKKLDSIYSKTGQFDRVRRLKEVNIKAKKIDQRYSSQGGLRVPEGHADLTIDMSKEKNFASMESFIRQKLSRSGIRFGSYRPDALGPEVMNYPYAPYRLGVVPMRIVVDGRRMNPEEAVDIFNNSSLDQTDIVKIDVVITGAMANMFDGPVIMFYTRPNRFIRNAELNVINLSPRGYNKVKSFYSPKYDRGNNNHFADLRSTVYWNPNLRVYASGKATFNYFNADGPGKYKVMVEGINAAGELGRIVYRYEVEASGHEFQAPIAYNNNIVASLDSLQRRLPVEKVYLHTDKPYYNLGDTLWFKSYLLNATNFTGSTRSGLLYVELVDDSSEVVRRISVPVTKGLSWAQIPLTDKIFQEGGYTLRAYTNWMQNFGSDYIFTKRLYLGKPSINTWLVQSKSKVNRLNAQDELEVDIQLKRSDNAPVGLKDVEVRIYEANRYISKQTLQTSQDGGLKFSSKLKEKADGRNLRVEIRNINKTDGNQLLHVPLRIKRNQFIDLQFLPESGYLVGGIHSLVGFKAIGEDGLGLNIAGKIYDSSGAEAATFASLHNGMGSFEFTPRPDESYTAKITLPEELENEYKLPAVNKEGIVLSLRRDQQSDSLSVEVAASSNAVQLDSTYYLVGTGRGKAYYSTAINFDKPVLKISSKTFPTGVVRFTLLKGRRPLNERIVFVDHNDQLDVRLSAKKPVYLQRDSITLDVEIKDKAGIPVQGSFSVAVTDDTQVKPDSLGNYGIGTSLLLNSDLQGKVENPGYYLNGAHADRIQALDNLMLTQGWKGYDWTNVFAPATEPKFLAEKEFKITGQVTNISKKPVADAQVLISSQKPSFITTTNTDLNGIFTFKDLPQIDSGSFFIQAKTAKGKTKYFGEVTVDRFQPAAIPPTFRDQLMPSYVNSDMEQLNYVQQIAKKTKEEFFKPSGISLKQVNIVSKKIIKGTFNRNGPGNADLIFDEKDIKESAVMNLYQLIKQKLPGFRVVMEDGLATLKYNNYMVTIEIDQGPLPVQLEPNTTAEQLIEELSQFKIAGFVGMEVMYSRKYMHNYSRPPSTVSYTSDQIFRSQERVRSLAFEGEEVDLEDNQAARRRSSVDVEPFYNPGFKGSGYLDERVNVLTNSLREVAVIGITTSQRVGWHRINKADVVSYRPLPLMKPAAFYSPKYLINPSEVAEPDFRSTILWEPNVTTDANGKAKISFYSADTAGKYTVSLEGTSTDGNIASKKVKLTVGNPSGKTTN